MSSTMTGDGSHPWWRALMAMAAALALVGLVTSPAGATPADDGAEAPAPETGTAIDGSYLVVLADGPGTQSADASLAAVTEQATTVGGTVGHVYESALVGFSVEGISADAAAALADDPSVAYVEQDQVFTVSAEQTNATWGLDRVDQRNNSLDNTYRYDHTGAGVDVYVIDTGVLTTHNDFTGRVVDHRNFTGDGRNSDCHGHGTHVAGTIGSETWGVAKDVNIYGIKVLGCNGSGSTSGIVAGLDWIAANHSGPSVANMSLGGGASRSLDAATQRLIDAGVFTAVAAGNSDADACNASPARTPEAVTVGSTTRTDARSGFSNFGTCVDIFAPGSGITSTWISNDNSTAVLSGTSMASPHVAGVAALYLESDTDATPAEVEAAMEGAATTGAVGNPGTGSPNLLLYSLVAAAPDPDPDPDPGSIGGSVTDTDGATVAGVTVDLFESNEAGDRLSYVGSAQTDGSGAYRFEVDAGCYAVTFIAPSGRSFTDGNSWFNAAACVAAGETVSGVDAVLQSTADESASIGGSVTGDGGGVAGVTVDLFTAAGDGSRGTYVRSTTTDGSGDYSFSVDAGCYVVTFIAPSGQQFTNGSPWLNAGVCVAAGETVDSLDAALAAAADASIGGRVTEADRDTVAGVTVDLFAATGDGSRGTYLVSTYTAGDGGYGFDVAAGCYVLTFIAPDGRTFTNGTSWLNVPACVASGENSSDNDAVLQ